MDSIRYFKLHNSAAFVVRIGVEVTDNDGKIYDLNGNQVKTPLKKGIYIKNGRKVVIK